MQIPKYFRIVDTRFSDVCCKYKDERLFCSPSTRVMMRNDTLYIKQDNYFSASISIAAAAFLLEDVKPIRIEYPYHLDRQHRYRVSILRNSDLVAVFSLSTHNTYFYKNARQMPAGMFKGLLKKWIL